MSIPFRLNLTIQILDKAGRKSITRKRMWLTVSTWSIRSMKQILIVFIKLLKDPICFYYISTRVELSDLNINIFAFCSPVALIFPVGIIISSTDFLLECVLISFPSNSMNGWLYCKADLQINVLETLKWNLPGRFFHKNKIMHARGGHSSNDPCQVRSLRGRKVFNRLSKESPLEIERERVWCDSKLLLLKTCSAASAAMWGLHRQPP